MNHIRQLTWCLGLTVMTYLHAEAIDPMASTARLLPRKLLADGVIVYGAPHNYKIPATYLDESHIQNVSIEMLWPSAKVRPIQHGIKLWVMLEYVHHLSPEVIIGLHALDANDIVHLSVSSNVLDERGFDILSRFRDIENVNGMIRNDDQAIRICDTWRKLQALTITPLSSESSISDRSLSRLNKLSRLRGLRIHSNQFSAAGFRSLREVPTLEGIHFGGSRTVRGNDIAALSQLPRLREVVLWVPADFRDADLLRFAELKGLEHICLFGAEGVTQNGVAALRALLPRCAIHVRAELGAPKYDDLPTRE